jgi:hypothetical protein
LSITAFCINITPTTLWLWLLIPLLPSWIPVITRRGSSIGLLGLESLRIATGVRLVTLVCAAREGLGLVEGLRGIWLALLLRIVWLRATGIAANLWRVRRWLEGTRWRGGRGWGTEWMIPGRAWRLCARVYVIPGRNQLSRNSVRRYCELPDVPGTVAIEAKAQNQLW